MKPKYTYGDKVAFNLEGQRIEGEVVIIDPNGTFLEPGEVSYDIMGEWNGQETLFKHIKESSLL